MSSIVSADEVWVLGNYASVSSFVFWTVDFVETLPAEINIMWKKRMTGASALFLVNRYSFLLNLVLQMVGSLPGNGSDRKCQIIYITYGVSSSISVAITNKWTINIENKWLMVSLFMCCKLTVFPSSASTSGSQFQDFTMCGVTTSDNYLKMYRLKESSITQVIILDATILAILSIVSLDRNIILPTTLELVIPFFDILPNLLISRLMLNLRTYSAPGNSITTTQGRARTWQSSLNFATNRMLGNIGAPLDGGSFGERDEQEEEEEEFRAVGERHEEFEQGQG
ncbi:hypothetical protein F5876DRAFT_69341 [Lentinula aff. lateritia]|uniref:Uncharacterized protein n=1 Tax=Lentinula aff. lateritia TaxID=2804960 RepID=A0ACC1TMX2_9AGAR|nr:hypothetical protein F5876DRAFT_69341 [Lentinula aff. lateritia]